MNRRGTLRTRGGRIGISLALPLLVLCMGGWLVWDRPVELPAQLIDDARPTRLVDRYITLQLVLGRSDSEATDWSGRITLQPHGTIVSLRNLDSQVEYDNGEFDAQSQLLQRRRQREGAATRPVRLQLVVDAARDATVVLTARGEQSSFRISETSLIEPLELRQGAVSVSRRPNHRQLTESPAHDDFPAVAEIGGSVWCAYVTYQPGTPVDERETAAGRFESLRPRGNGDQVRLIRFRDGQWSQPINVTESGMDVWRPTVVAASDDEIWVVWSQQLEGNWDLFARRFHPNRGTLGIVHRLTNDPGTDIFPVATSAQQRVWIAWQSRRGDDFDIRVARLSDLGQLRSEKTVSTSRSNDWNPSIASGPDGGVWIAWDTYDKGDYDVYIRQLLDGALDRPIAVATSSRFEARPHLAVDNRNRPWIAFENGDSNWGKDYGPRLTGKGLPFYYERTILVRCLDEGVMQTVAAPDSPPIFTHYDDTRYKPEFKRRMSMPRVAFDQEGRLWLLYRHHPAPENARGEVWSSYAQYYQAGSWSGEIPLTQSENLLDNRPALAPLENGNLLVVHSCDGRSEGGARTHQVNNLIASLLRAEHSFAPLKLVPAKASGDGPAVEPADPLESKNVARCRDYRVVAGGVTYQLLRGEFHRHTEVSAHRDWDGPLEEVWRYGLDVAAMDWIGPGDHDYGVGHDYLWWFTQKQIDLYYQPQRFLTMYTYERSKSYPSGHRNVMFSQRGIRTLPALTARQNKTSPIDGELDIKNLYGYLRYFGGICSSHTSATNMGTDWRDSDPELEPVVEIFQGHRQNYEKTGAPLAATGPDDTIQGYRPAGFVWEAFKKGIRLGFQASSDHVSTHTSYAFVLAEKPTRAGLIEAFKKRHSYAANDNIVLDVRCGEYIMGDEFRWKGKPALKIRVIGTAPIARLDIIRQVGQQTPQYVYRNTPRAAEIDMRWTDDQAGPGLHMYYVRIQQEDQRLAWASPMWIHCE